MINTHDASDQVAIKLKAWDLGMVSGYVCGLNCVN